MYCEICGRGPAEKHHVFFGSANRKKSEKFGLVAYLCIDHHRDGPKAAHRCRETDLYLKEKYQRIFEESHSREEFMREFGRNYL